MSFTPADSVSLLAFVAICVGIVLAFWRAVYIVEPKWLTRAVIGTALWLGLLGALVGIGVTSVPVPGMMLFFGVSNAGAIALAASRVGKRLAGGLSVFALVSFQGFRLPLELVLHAWFESGTIPESMTWTGSNWDIISGVVAIGAAPLAPKSRGAAWSANVVGVVLLANVARVAILSLPVPFGWGVTPPLLLGMHLPYAFIVPICVAGALAGHIILTRKLLAVP